MSTIQLQGHFEMFPSAPSTQHAAPNILPNKTSHNNTSIWEWHMRHKIGQQCREVESGAECTPLQCTALICPAPHCAPQRCTVHGIQERKARPTEHATPGKQNAQYAVRTTHCTQHTARCTLHTAHCTLHTAHCTLHTAHCTLHTAHCTLHTAHCTLHTTHYTLHTTHYTLHTTHYTLHAARCTLHAARCTQYMLHKLSTHLAHSART